MNILDFAITHDYKNISLWMTITIYFIFLFFDVPLNLFVEICHELVCKFLTQSVIYLFFQQQDWKDFIVLLSIENHLLFHYELFQSKCFSSNVKINLQIECQTFFIIDLDCCLIELGLRKSCWRRVNGVLNSILLYNILPKGS